MVGREGLGAYVGGHGPLLGPMLAVLGRSWGLCRRSWSLLGPMLAVLGGLRPRSGPNQSRKVIWPADLSQKVAQTLAGEAFGAGDGNRLWTSPPGPRMHFFYRYVYMCQFLKHEYHFWEATGNKLFLQGCALSKCKGFCNRDIIFILVSTFCPVLSPKWS